MLVLRSERTDFEGWWGGYVLDEACNSCSQCRGLTRSLIPSYFISVCYVPSSSLNGY